MAQRDIYQQRQVLNSVPEVTPDPVGHDAEIQAGIKVEENIIEKNQAAKINENFSSAQLGLQQLQNKYEVDHQDDPYKAQNDLMTARKKMFDDLGQNIDPYYRGVWNENVQQLGAKHDLVFDNWATAQTKKNTVTSINKSLQTNLTQAEIAGQNFGNGTETDINAAMDFNLSHRQLAATGDQIIGKQETDKLLENHSEDYLKVFLSGVSDTNPIKALKLLDDPGVKNSFKNPLHYDAMRKSIESRALNVQEINGKKEILNTMKDENNVLAQSLNQPMSYVDFQQYVNDHPTMSTYAKSFFAKANGFTADDAKLTPGQKVEQQGQLYDDITKMVTPAETHWYGDKEATLNDGNGAQQVSAMQGRIYKAMSEGVIDQKTGADYLAQIVEPLANDQEQGLQNFAKKNNLSDGLGLDAVKDYYDKSVEIQPTADEVADDKSVGPTTSAQNSANKVFLYNSYYSALGQEAKTRNIPISGISKLPDTQKQAIYKSALNASTKALMVKKNPALATLNDLPNQIFKDGQIVQGALGPRDIKPNFTVNSGFKDHIGSDGNIWRDPGNGAPWFVIGKAPKAGK